MFTVENEYLINRSLLFYYCENVKYLQFDWLKQRAYF